MVSRNARGTGWQRIWKLVLTLSILGYRAHFAGLHLSIKGKHWARWSLRIHLWRLFLHDTLLKGLKWLCVFVVGQVLTVVRDNYSNKHTGEKCSHCLSTFIHFHFLTTYDYKNNKQSQHEVSQPTREGAYGGRNQGLYPSHLTDEEVEAQRGSIICLKLHS